MRIVLATLNSKFIHSNLSLWCIKAGIDSFCINKHNVIVKESTVNADCEDFLDEIISIKPDIVAFSCYIWNIEKILPLCKQIQEKTGCITVLGGPETEYRQENILRNNRCVDYVISGEGEWSFSSFVNCLDNGSCFECSEGLSFIGNDIFVSYPKKCHRETPPSPYSDEYFRSLNGRIAYIEASRGCPFSCAYCLSGQLSGLRYFDEQTVFDNIIKLSHSGTKTIKFIDRTFNADAEKANRILTFIKDNHGKEINKDVCFHFEIAADILKESTLKILSEMPVGLCQLETGIQSFNRKTLDSIGRKSDLDKLCNNVKRLVSFRNMHIHTDLIAGLPYEDFESFKNSFNKAFELKSDMLQLGFLKLLFGAEMRENYSKYPCSFNPYPPYEIVENEWISKADISKLKCCEEALERLYNSRRFINTLDFLIDDNGMDPFELFCEFGASYDFFRIGLTEFVAILFNHFKNRCNSSVLREKILSDIYSCPVNIRIPDELMLYDPAYKSLMKKYSELLKKNICIVILYSEAKVLVIHTDTVDKISNRYKCEYYDL